MTRDQLRKKAQRLREQGLSYREVGERLGLGSTPDSANGMAQKLCNPEKAKEWTRRTNAKRGPAKREWERTHRAACPSCGAPMAAGSHSRSKRGKRCKGCVADEAEQRTRRALQLRKQGLLNYEIAEEMGTTPQSIASTLSRDRVARYGLEHVQTPYGPTLGHEHERQAA